MEIKISQSTKEMLRTLMFQGTWKLFQLLWMCCVRQTGSDFIVALDTAIALVLCK